MRGGVARTAVARSEGRLAVTERVLCDAELRVLLDGGGERALLVVTDSKTVRFWTDTALLESTLRGDPAQLSAQGGFCQIEREGDRIRLEFGLSEHPRKRCEFPAEEFAQALAWVRSLGSPFEQS